MTKSQKIKIGTPVWITLSGGMPYGSVLAFDRDDWVQVSFINARGNRISKWVEARDVRFQPEPA